MCGVEMGDKGENKGKSQIVEDLMCQAENVHFYSEGKERIFQWKAS